MNDLKRFLITSWYPHGKNDGDLAKLLKVDQSLLSKWLNDVIQPSIERKIQIAQALGVDSRLIFSAGVNGIEQNISRRLPRSIKGISG
jgi:transcriptional regulator with XRE-family HTH domain